MDGSPKLGGRPAVLLFAAILTLAAALAYANSFHSPFVFDDVPAILENATIHSFRQSWTPPGGGLSVSGRPLVNVTFALSYALSGENVWGFHLLNVLIHALAGLTLFGVVRRTLLLPVAERARVSFRNGTRARPAPPFDATLFAASVALLWTLHPLQTESVTYLVQRAESLVGLFYLLTLYTFIRAADSNAPRSWQIASLVACLGGMASKEVMATAPLVVLLYDRTFVAGNFRAAWQQRRGLYLGYAATWLLLLGLVVGTGNRGGTAGFGLNISPLDYLFTQGQAIVRYLGLSFWPHPLVLDYGLYVARSPLAIVPFLLIVLALLALTLVALRRWPVAGFLGATFFLILGPTSSFVPVATQTIAEHRMYLPLATVMVAVVWGLYASLGLRAWVAAGALAVVLGGLTAARNTDYRTAFALWSDTVARRPDNFRARYNRALQLMDLGRRDEAVAESLEAVRRDPDNSDSHYNYGLILLKVGRVTEAIAEHRAALKLRPWFADAHTALGNALMEAGQMSEAIAEFTEAIKHRPDSGDAHNNLGGALTKIGRPTDALPHFAEALRVNPDSATAHSNLGDALGKLGRTDDALKEINLSLQLKPDLPEAHYALASLLLRLHRAPESIPHFQEAVRLKPEFAEAHLLLGGALLATGRTDDALREYAEAQRLAPISFEVHFNYGNTLFQLGRTAEAALHYREALRLKPDLVGAHYNLAHVLLQQNQLAEAAQEFTTTLKLDPAHVDARYNLANCQLLAGQLEEAAKNFAEVVRLVPTSIDGHTMLADTLMQLRRPADAIPHYEESLRLKPDDAEVRAHLAQARAASNNRR